MIKAVIFDMDGLMVDTEIISYQCYKEIIEYHHFKFTKEEYSKQYPGKSVITSLNFINNHYHINLDIDKEVKHFSELEEKYMAKDGVTLKDGLCILLQYLKEHQYKMVIATSSHKDRANRILENHDIIKYFDTIVCGSDVKRGKPFPDIFLEACKRLKVSPDEALVLEDSEAGIQAAFDATIPVICIPDMKYPQEDYVKKVESIFPSLHDVITYLESKKEF